MRQRYRRPYCLHWDLKPLFPRGDIFKRNALKLEWHQKNSVVSSSQSPSFHRYFKKETKLTEPTLSELWKTARGSQQIKKHCITNKKKENLKHLKNFVTLLLVFSWLSVMGSTCGLRFIFLCGHKEDYIPFKNNKKNVLSNLLYRKHCPIYMLVSKINFNKFQQHKIIQTIYSGHN